jgi:triosephosphate isomerase (TIM)
MRKRYLIANWKMNLPPEGIDAYLAAMGEADARDVAVVVAPPFPFLKDIRGLAVAAQNCSDHASGAYTGEVAPAMVRECGAGYVIVGHSERRQLFHENDALIARKIAIAIQTGLTPVLCIGEDLRIRDSGQVARYLADQLRATADAGLDAAKELVIAYEPIWAIGTGRNASGAMVAETVTEIRHSLERFWPSRYSGECPILYGGSVTPENVDDLVANGGIDGFLVGGASLDSSKFSAILAGLTRGA